MPHHCPFPVRSTDSRRGYHTGSAPCFTLGLALVAVLSGYAGFSHAAPAANGHGGKPMAMPTPMWDMPRAAFWSRPVPGCRKQRSTRR
jgi:hypothetical protein